MDRAAASIPAASVMVRPLSSSASGMLGVTTSANGSSLWVSASMASVRSRREPEVATITGSTTRCFAW